MIDNSQPEPKLTPAGEVVFWSFAALVVAIPISLGVLMFRGCAATVQRANRQAESRRATAREQFGPAMPGVDAYLVRGALEGSGWTCEGRSGLGWTVSGNRERAGQIESVSWYGVDAGELCSISVGSVGINELVARQTLATVAHLVGGDAVSSWVNQNWSAGGEARVANRHLVLTRSPGAANLTITASP